MKTSKQGKHHLTFVESIVTGKDGKLYFCGVFRKPLRKKQHQANNHTDNVDISNSGAAKNLVDPFTKGLSRVVIENASREMGMKPT